MGSFGVSEQEACSRGSQQLRTAVRRAAGCEALGQQGSAGGERWDAIRQGCGDDGIPVRQVASSLWSLAVRTCRITTPIKSTG